MAVELNVYQKWRMCARKKSFETLSKANKTAFKFGQYPYECDICHTWHLTKKKKENNKIKDNIYGN